MSRITRLNVVSVITQLKTPTFAFASAFVLSLFAWWVVPYHHPTSTALAITLFSIVLWITNAVPPTYTSLIAIGLLGLTFTPELAFTGFRSPATWLIGFGLLMGEATCRSGLAARVGHRITVRVLSEGMISNPQRAYASLLVGLCLVGLLLAILVPSTIVRILILMPVLREAGRQFDSAEARTGLFLGPLFATFYGAAGILTAAVPNIIITGIVKSVGGPTITWTEWALDLFLLMGVARTFLVAGVVYFLYRPDPNTSFAISIDDLEQSTAQSRRMFTVLLLGMAIWVTDFVHQFHPVFGAIVVVVLALAPRIGVVEFQDVVEDIDYSILFFIGAVFAIGEALTQTGFADTAAEGLLTFVPTDGTLFVLLFFVFLSTMLLALLLEGLVVASVLTPILVSFTNSAGIPLVPVVMTEAIALSAYFFPYQSAVLVTMLAEDAASTRDLIRTATACTIATIVVLLPIQFAIFTLLY